MIAFGTPLGLTALAAVAVPLVIHLIRRPVPTVRLGSLRFLTKAQRRLSSPRWRDLLLLAVRCILLAALGLLFAAPRWVPDGTAPVRWVLRVPGEILDADAQRSWQQYVDEGFSPRFLALDFPTREPASGPTQPDIWSYLREADLRLPAGSRVIVVAAPRLGSLIGDRPVMRRIKAEWIPSTLAVAHAQAHEAAAVPSRVRVAVIASPDRADDARFVRGAVTALNTLGREVELTELEPDWVFQLGSIPLPPAWSERVRLGARLVTDAQNPTRLSRERTFASQGRTVTLLRRTAPEAASTSDAAILVDNIGEPVISVIRLGAGWHWRFVSRFHPDATDWVLGSSFPAWWGQQWRPEKTPDEFPGVTTLSQVIPREETGQVVESLLPRIDSIDLRLPLAVFGLLALAFERSLVHRASRNKAVAAT